MTKRRREAWAKWRGLMTQQKRSGESVAAFCRERGLCAPHFFAWKKQLSDASPSLSQGRWAMKAWSFVFALALVILAAASPSQQTVLPVQEAGAKTTLIVTHADVPLYPPVAVAAHHTGTVHLRVSIRQGAVLSADTDSAAPSVLVLAAKENIKTWRFTPDVTDNCEVTFIYELLEAHSVVPENPRIEMQLPSFVKITAKPVKPMPMDGR
jgi:hypothetical protein